MYQKALQTQDHDDHGEFDATMSDPGYLLLARQAHLYWKGGFGLEKDPNRAGNSYGLREEVCDGCGWAAV